MVEISDADRQRKHPPSLIWWLGCTVTLYYLSVATYTFYHNTLPTFDTKSDFYRSIVSKGIDYDTQHISLANLAFYVTMNFYGFIYVNVSNMNCSRQSIFYSSYPTRSHFVKLMLMTPVCYFMGAMYQLKAPTDQ